MMRIRRPRPVPPIDAVRNEAFAMSLGREVADEAHRIGREAVEAHGTPTHAGNRLSGRSRQQRLHNVDQLRT